MFAAIDFGQLLEVIWVALAAGLVVPSLYGLAIYGSTRAAEARRSGNGGAATRFLTVAIVAGAIFAATIVLGITFTLRK